MPPGKTDVIFFDEAMPGFGYRLRVAAGGKICVLGSLNIVMPAESRRLLLGSAAALGADQARVMAKKALGQVANGEDPQADKQHRRGKDRQTFKTTVADYLAIKQREVRGRTFVEKSRYLTDKRYFGPLHGLALDQITRADVAARLNRITRGEQPDCSRARPRPASCAV